MHSDALFHKRGSRTPNSTQKNQELDFVRWANIIKSATKKKIDESPKYFQNFVDFAKRKVENEL